MPNIIHVGLGKTATTSLQKYVFPLLAQKKGFIYNNPALMPFIQKSKSIELSYEDLKSAKTILNTNNNLISYEALASWDPAYFEIAANKNLKLFGEEAIILITLREAKSYITSLYQQIIHQGNVIAPQYFFISKEQYKLAKQMSSMNKIDYYCCDYLDYSYLYNLYKDRFYMVQCVDMQNISSLRFLEGIIDLSDDEKKDLSNIFINAPQENKSYSDLAMRLTFARENLLNKFGIKSFGSNERRLEDLKESWQFPKSFPKHKIPFNELRFQDKIIQFLPRMLRKIFPPWRHFIQARFDKLLPYKKYELPMELSGINQEKLDKCNEFLRSIDIK
jgi:hypothetical protein